MQNNYRSRGNCRRQMQAAMIRTAWLPMAHSQIDMTRMTVTTQNIDNVEPRNPPAPARYDSAALCGYLQTPAQRVPYKRLYIIININIIIVSILYRDFCGRRLQTQTTRSLPDSQADYCSQHRHPSPWSDVCVVRYESWCCCHVMSASMLQASRSHDQCTLMYHQTQQSISQVIIQSINNWHYSVPRVQRV